MVEGESSEDTQARKLSSASHRYAIVDGEIDQALVCTDSPEIKLHVIRGLTVNEAGRQEFSQQTVFLDGVFNGPPFYDNHTRQYSLDHHVGCVRAFTLATCEQAAVMLLQGMPLSEGEWTIFANDPDLDALLASWLLMNHEVLLAHDARLLAAVMPLVRVEGTIDAHGLDMSPLTALPELVYQEHKQTIDRLLERERDIKTAGGWSHIDFTRYSREMLESLDLLLLPSDRERTGIVAQELQTRTIENGKLAVLCQSKHGIYEVELVLKERHGKSLGVIVLDRGTGSYTLRLVDPFLTQNLENVYVALNAADPRVDAQDLARGYWGGSGEIGGSPRKSGSGLAAHRVFEIVVGQFA